MIIPKWREKRIKVITASHLLSYEGLVRNIPKNNIFIIVSQRWGFSPISESHLALIPEAPSPAPWGITRNWQGGTRCAGFTFQWMIRGSMPPGHRHPCTRPVSRTVRGQGGTESVGPQQQVSVTDICIHNGKNSAVTATRRRYRNLHFYPSLCNALGFYVFMFAWDFLP